MRIGILTFHNAYNCGALLQAYALSEVLKEWGYVVEFVDCNEVGRFSAIPSARSVRDLFLFPLRLLNMLGIGQLRIRRYGRFRRRWLKIVPEGATRQCPYDCLIVGSDQVWNPGLTGDALETFLLKGLGAPLKIAYAASFGIASIPERLKSTYEAGLRRFSVISVRERRGQELVAELIGRQVPLVVDPTLLADASLFGPAEAPQLVRRPYLCVYSVGEDEHLRKQAQRVAAMLGLKLVYIQNGRMGYLGGHVSDWRVTSPDRFLSLIRHSQAVMTNSFHGTIFSILYERPFLTLRGKATKVASRLETLLDELRLQSHYVDGVTEADAGTLRRLMAFDIDSMRLRRQRLRESSLDFLRTALGQRGG